MNDDDDEVKWNLGQVTGQQITILSFLDLLFQIKLPRQNSFYTRLQTKASFNKNCLCSNLM